MAGVNVGEELEETRQGLFCDICREDEQTIEAQSFCYNCKKYLCAQCDKCHGKFSLDHKTVYGKYMPLSKDVAIYTMCTLHTTQEVKLYCENHSCLLCVFCQEVRHSKCTVKDIHSVCKAINVSNEFESTFKLLEELNDRMIQKNIERQAQIETYSKEKENRKSEISLLRAELNALLDKYEDFVETYGTDQMERLKAFVATENVFMQQATEQIREMKDAKLLAKDEDQFLILVNLQQFCSKYENMFEELSKSQLEHIPFTFYDDKLPTLVRKISELNSTENASSDENELNQPKIVDDTSKKSFWNVKSVTCIKEVDFKEVSYQKVGCISACCHMPDEQVILYDSDNCKLILLDKDLSIKCDIKYTDSFFDVAVADETSVVATVPTKKMIQFVYVKPGLKLGRQVLLDRTCYGIAVHNNDMFICTSFKSPKQIYNTVLVVSQTGNVLKEMVCPIDESLKYLCCSSDTMKLFLSSGSSSVYCITKDNYIIFKYFNRGISLGNSILKDEADNLLISYSEWFFKHGIYVIESGGKCGKALLTEKDIISKPTAIAFDRKNDILIVASYKNINNVKKPRVSFFKLEYN